MVSLALTLGAGVKNVFCQGGVFEVADDFRIYRREYQEVDREESSAKTL